MREDDERAEQQREHQHHVDRLQRRANHLTERLLAAAETQNVSFDKKELSALLWALPLLREHLSRERNRGAVAFEERR